jgi:hypothetical protein
MTTSSFPLLAALDIYESFCFPISGFWGFETIPTPILRLDEWIRNYVQSIIAQCTVLRNGSRESGTRLPNFLFLHGAGEETQSWDEK